MLHTEEIEYRTGEVHYRGYLAYDKSTPGPKPCILIAPDWSGRSMAFCQKAEQLAQQGYASFVVDMYGDAQLGHTIEEKQALLNPLIENRPQVTTRMLAAFNTVSALSVVDNTRIAAMGYCFGGLCVLDLARSGVDVKGVMSFHGLLFPPEQTISEEILAKVLVFHGYDDPMVPPTQVNQFAQEMTQKKADWQIHMYGHTKHAFTNPEAHDASLGLQYNEMAARRSWINAEIFLREIFNNHS
jgi:dienelactone hydrolase